MSKPKPITNFVFTDHALFEMERRNISKDIVSSILAEPEQMEVVRAGRVVYHAKINLGDPPKSYLLRVFIDVDYIPPKIVTVYKTSKIEKYWR